MKVRKAVIPVAGFGTRLLPLTKSVPKGMMPVAGKPIIHHIVAEVVASGIDDVVLVTSSRDKPLEDYFDRNFELDYTLERTGKQELLAEMRRITSMAHVAYVRQKEPLGNGHAILMAKDVVGDEPFVMLWGDDILIGQPPVPQQLIDVAERYNGPVVGVRSVSPEYFDKYGMLQVEPLEGPVSRALSVIEKPKREESPSDLAQIGGFVLTPDIFGLLETTPPGPSGELYLADALNYLMHQRAVFAYEFSGQRYDTGNHLDFLRANVALTMASPELGPAFREILQSDNVQRFLEQ